MVDCKFSKSSSLISTCQHCSPLIKELILKSTHLPPHYYHLLSSNYLEVVKKISKWKCSLTSVFEICAINSSANAYDVLHSNSKDIWKPNKLLPKIRIFVWSDVRVLWLVFMFDYTLEIMQVYINQNLMPLKVFWLNFPSPARCNLHWLWKDPSISNQFPIYAFSTKSLPTPPSTIILITIIFIIF